MMNCTTVRRYLYAFTDGELAVKENCEVLDHLKMCPACTRIASEQQALRVALRRSMNHSPVPDGLVERVAASIEQPAPEQFDGRRRLWRLVVPTAVAASLALVATTLWLNRRPSEPAPVAPVVSLRALGDAALQQVIDVHESCCRQQDQHQNAKLPGGLKGLVPAMAEHFGDVLEVLAPDFSKDGYRLESANYCGFTKNRGTHLIYVKNGPNPKRLSFFSVPRWTSIDDCGYYKGVEDGFLRKFRATHEKPRYAVVAWHDNQTTYICCGELGAISVDKLARMVEPVRTAMPARGK